MPKRIGNKYYKTMIISRRRSRSRYWVLVGVLFPTTAFVNGQFAYCCDITKCKLIENACRNAPLVNGSSCLETCLADSEFTCRPANLDSLATRNYTCFEAFIRDAPRAPLEKICGQRYSPDKPPAPVFLISHWECLLNCGGWAVAQWSDPQVWATPLIQYILPAVIFTMNIPRRRRLAAGDGLFNFELDKWTSLGRALVSLGCAGCIVVLDTFVWICITFSIAGPLIVEGLHEAVLDWKVVMNLRAVELDETGSARHLVNHERVELMNAVLCGNLDLDVNDPQTVIDKVIKLPNDRPCRKNIRMVQDAHSALMTSQYSFGQTVGAPVLFYLGSFLYNSVSLTRDKGDNSVAHGLAFGMWWMAIVHAAIVAGCLLANNNSSTITGIVSRFEHDNNEENPPTYRKPDRFERSGLSTVYNTRFHSVTMWTRGVTKRSWIRNTSAWRRVWFQKRISLGIQSWILVGTAASSLILVPSLLAGLVSYNTPRIGPGCRFMTFLLYACCQMWLISITICKSISGVTVPEAFSTFYRMDIWRENWIKALVWAFLFFITTAAILLALFTAVAGTMMQVIGVYSNCWCAIPITTWSNPRNQQCNIARNTWEDISASKFWAGTGFAAIAFMGVTCYLGWWYQRYLRSRFLREVEELGSELNGQDRTH